MVFCPSCCLLDTVFRRFFFLFFFLSFFFVWWVSQAVEFACIGSRSLPFHLLCIHMYTVKFSWTVFRERHCLGYLYAKRLMFSSTDRQSLSFMVEHPASIRPSVRPYVRSSMNLLSLSHLLRTHCSDFFETCLRYSTSG